MILLIPYINLLNSSWIKNVYFLKNIEPLSPLYTKIQSQSFLGSEEEDF